MELDCRVGYASSQWRGVWRRIHHSRRGLQQAWERRETAAV